MNAPTSDVFDVAVIGAGAWGTALSILLAQKGEQVVLWTWQKEHCDALRRDRENRAFFPGFALPGSVAVTSDLGEAAGGASMIVLVVPSDAFRATLVGLPWATSFAKLGPDRNVET